MSTVLGFHKYRESQRKRLEAIVSSGVTINRFATETGLHQGALGKFVKDRKGLTTFSERFYRSLEKALNSWESESIVASE